jgi:O-antigen/teichoic acid export membrane protein
MIAALVATGAIVVVSGYDGETALIIIAVAASKAVEGMSDVHYGSLQQNERMRPIAASLASRGVLAAIAVGVVLWAGGGLLLAIAAIGASWLVVLIAHDRHAVTSLLRDTAQTRAARVDWTAARRIVAIAFPLGLVMMLVSLRTNIPRYFIENRVGTAELGVFAALSSLVAAGNIVISALGQSATPRMARHYHDRNLGALRRLLARLLLVAALCGGAGIVLAAGAGRQILMLMFGADYARSADVLVWLMAVGLVAYATSFLGYALTATRRFTIQLPLFASTSLACAVGCHFLVPEYGLTGAAWAWGASLLLECVAIAVILSLDLRERSPRS